MYRHEDTPVPRDSRPVGSGAQGQYHNQLLAALGVVFGPFLLVFVPFLVLSGLGLLGAQALETFLYLSAYVSYAVLLPLVVWRVAEKREERARISGDWMAFFSSKVVALYAACEERPALLDDPRAAEVFALYARAEREIQDDPDDPLGARKTIERGVNLADEVLGEDELPDATTGDATPGA